MTALTVQVVIDCGDPHALADWWAETLGWQVEPHDEEFIRSMIKQGYATEDDTTRHRNALVWREGAAIHPASEPSPQRLRIFFQRVPEAKTVKNRVHLDVRAGETALDEFRRRLVERGATVVGGGRQGPHTWVTLADPEGNEFCV